MQTPSFAVSPLTDKPWDKEINFGLSFIPTERSPAHNYIVRTDTDEVIEVRGKKFRSSAHPEFFGHIHQMLVDNMEPDDLKGVYVQSRIARNGGWALQDITFPSMKAKVETSRHKTEVALRGIFWHGVDGTCANNGIFGAIDFYCTNGMISGEYDRVRRKNTSGFDIVKFVEEIRKSKVEFMRTYALLQKMAETQLTFKQAQSIVKGLIESERKQEKMIAVLRSEVDVRGENVWALYSALTNYSSHANDNDNGFKLRKSINDNTGLTMFNREIEVSKWTSSPQFQKLLAA